MIKRKFVFSFMSVAYILFCILPFASIVRYSTMATDDFCIVTSDSADFFSRVVDWYSNLNGRYINALLTNLAFFDDQWRRIFLFVQFFVLGIVLVYFCRTLFKLFVLRMKYHEIGLVITLFYVSIIANAPSLYELFYWYSAVTVYLVSFFFFLVFMSEVAKQFIGVSASMLPLAFSIVLLNGNNELFIGITNFLLLLLLLKALKGKGSGKAPYFYLNVLSWLSSAAFIFAPGSSARQEHFEYGGNFIGSLKVAFFYGGKYLLENLIDISYLLFYVLVFILVYGKAKPGISRSMKPGLLFIVSFISMASMFFIVYYATGLFDIRTGRIGNLVSMVTLVFAFINVANLAVIFRNKKEVEILHSTWVPYLLLIAFTLNLTLREGNYSDLLSDFENNRYEQLQKEMVKRDSLISNSNKKVLVLTPIEGTLFIKSGDAYLARQESIRKCYLDFINKEYGKSFESLTILIP